MQTINLTLSVEQFNVVRKTLGQLPHDQIGGLIRNIENQAQAQVQAANTPPPPQKEVEEAIITADFSKA